MWSLLGACTGKLRWLASIIGNPSFQQALERPIGKIHATTG